MPDPVCHIFPESTYHIGKQDKGWSGFGSRQCLSVSYGTFLLRPVEIWVLPYMANRCGGPWGTLFLETYVAPGLAGIQ